MIPILIVCQRHQRDISIFVCWRFLFLDAGCAGSFLGNAVIVLMFCFLMFFYILAPASAFVFFDLEEILLPL